jgi:membrane protein DedA with SNARE-associated domain
MTDYPWRRFFVWDALGETLWVVLYVLLGKVFSGSVQALVEVLGNLAWVLVGIVVAAILFWWIVRSLQDSPRRALPNRV